MELTLTAGCWIKCSTYLAKGFTPTIAIICLIQPFYRPNYIQEQCSTHNPEIRVDNLKKLTTHSTVIEYQARVKQKQWKSQVRHVTCQWPLTYPFIQLNFPVDGQFEGNRKCCGSLEALSTCFQWTFPVKFRIVGIPPWYDLNAPAWRYMEVLVSMICVGSCWVY